MSAPTPLRVRYESIKFRFKVFLGATYGIACILVILAFAFGAFDFYGSQAKYAAYAFLIGFAVWLAREWRLTKRLRQAAIRRANEQHGTAFDLKNGLGFGRGMDLTLFDPERKKILFLKHDGRFYWLYGFEQIDSWKINWTENTRRDRISGRQVTHREFIQIQFFLKDINTPSMTMGVASYEAANDWSQRISLLLRGVNTSNQAVHAR